MGAAQALPGFARECKERKSHSAKSGMSNAATLAPSSSAGFLPSGHGHMGGTWCEKWFISSGRALVVPDLGCPHGLGSCVWIRMPSPIATGLVP